MNRLLRPLVALLLIAWLAACAAPTASPIAAPGAAATAPAAQSVSPSATPAPGGIPTSSPTQATPASAPAPTYAAQTVDGGSVSVTVTPLALAPGGPVAFDVAMNTHSVELKDDLLKVSVLRDDRGTEVAPIAWEGAGPGGHHRAGTLKFPALSGEPSTLTLVLRNIAGVPERKFQWDLSN
jgi:hypothetical protein